MAKNTGSRIQTDPGLNPASAISQLQDHRQGT